MSSAQAASMRQLSEEQEMAMDFSSEASGHSAMMNFDSGSSGYGSTVNGHSNGSDITHSTFVSDSSSMQNNNNSNSSKRNGVIVKKEPVTKVLSSTSC